MANASSRDRSGPARPAARRLVLHGALALLATPLPGGLLVGGRLLAGRRWRAGSACLALALAATLSGVWAAFRLPVPIPTSALLLLLLWVAAGSGLALLEVRWKVAPEPETAARSRTGAQIATWACVAGVVLIPWAFFLAETLSRWGSELFGKPSMARQVLLVAVLCLAPLGACVGLARGLLRRPHRPGPPVLFGFAFAAAQLAAVSAFALYYWLVSELAGLESVDTVPRLTGIWLLLAVWAFGVPLGFGHYLSEARGARDFALRLAAAAFPLFLLVANLDLLSSGSPLASRITAADRAAGEGRHEAAFRHWSWIVDRAPAISLTRRAVEKGAREALLAGKPELARRLLSEVGPDLGAEVSSTAVFELVERLLRSGLDLARVARAPIRPIRKESYLDSDWSILLTAVRAARPELGEAELKRRLHDVSLSAERIALEPRRPMLALRLAAGLFDCRALAIPFERHREALAAGLPLLFLPETGSGWRLLFWEAPGADAVQWLDYGRWGDSGEELDRASRRNLLEIESDEAADTRVILARIARLGSRSLLAEKLDREGGWVFVVVGRGEEERWQEAFPGARRQALDLERLDAARWAVSRQAFRRGLTLAAPLPAGDAREELMAAAWLGAESRSSPEGAGWDEGREAAAGRLARGGLETSSYWFLEELLRLPERELGCDLRRQALDASLAILPRSTSLLADRLALAVAERDPEAAARLALRLARQRRWSPKTILETLGQLAPLDGVAEHPAGREALETLTARLPLLVDVESGSYRRRAAEAPYCAARAALSATAGESLAWWRRAVELAPLEAGYRARLADALHATGETWLAARERERGAALAPVSPCRLPAIGTVAVAASGMGASEARR